MSKIPHRALTLHLKNIPISNSRKLLPDMTICISSYSNTTTNTNIALGTIALLVMVSIPLHIGVPPLVTPVNSSGLSFRNIFIIPLLSDEKVLLKVSQVLCRQPTIPSASLPFSHSSSEDIKSETISQPIYSSLLFPFKAHRKNMCLETIIESQITEKLHSTCHHRPQCRNNENRQ